MSSKEDLHKFETGAVRSADNDTVAYWLISPIGLRRVAERYKLGQDKYPPYNWENGIPISNLINHAIGHIFKYLSGDRSDDHLAAAAWGMMAACHSEEAWPHLNKDLRPAQPISNDVAKPNTGGPSYRIIDYADGVSGHYCIGKTEDGIYWSYWHDKYRDWKSAGSLYTDLDAAKKKMRTIMASEQK